jgi:signal transduction histidine kinase
MTRDGQPLVIASRWAIQRDDDGNPLRILEINRDVTREREVDRMKTEFVSLVSHELRTPLTSIKGFADLLLDGEAGDVTEEQREFLSIIRNNSDRLTTLVSNLLDVARIESGTLTVKRSSLDLGRLVDDVSRSLRPAAEAKGQRLLVTHPPILPAVLGDAGHLAEIVTNLLSNAIKYTPAGGSIDVAVQALDGRIRIDVADSGIGLSPDDQHRLFTKFFRAENDATRAVSGTGLGLYITKGLVELQGGEICVTSDGPGRGSTFSVELSTLDALSPRGPDESGQVG